MRNVSRISEKKQKLIDEVNNSQLKRGDIVSVDPKKLFSYSRSTIPVSCEIKKINKNTLVVRHERTEYTIKKEDISARNLGHIGVNPFFEEDRRVRSVAYTFDSILHTINAFDEKDEIVNKPFLIKGIQVKEINWNPFVYVNGKKKYYQRDFVWSLKDKQNLIESIYQNISCGKILLRNRSFQELEEMTAKGEKELSFKDVVDGKQRLNAVISFIKGEFADLQGNYFNDLSGASQHKLVDHQLFSYAEIEENTSDELVLKQFLKLNFSGVPQSEEHINYVKSLML